jgi:hypothetical protein
MVTGLPDGRYPLRLIVQQPRCRSSDSDIKGWPIVQLIKIYYYTKENSLWCIYCSRNYITNVYIYKQMIIKTVYDALIFIPWMLFLSIRLTINSNIYCCRYQTTDVITSCTLIGPCLVPVYILQDQY